MAGVVPESFKKKEARNAELAKAAAAAEAEAAKAAVAFNKAIYEKAQAYEQEYEASARQAIENRRIAKANNQVYVAPEEKVVFVVRIRGIIGVSPKVKMINLVEPFIAYGYPNLKSVRELIYKRGYGKVSGQRVPLSSNDVVQEGLTGLPVNCIEDVIHEIFTVGPNFKEVNNFLWPFKLPSPRHGFPGKKKLIHFNEGGACGMQGDKINHLIKKMI